MGRPHPARRNSFVKLSEAKIRARWQWDKTLPVKATRANIRLAILRTRNPYGITTHGVPYIAPVVGMAIKLTSGETGVISALRPPLSRGGDPECQIRTLSGRTVYLFQTAINGFTPLPARKSRKRLKKA